MRTQHRRNPLASRWRYATHHSPLRDTRKKLIQRLLRRNLLTHQPIIRARRKRTHNKILQETRLESTSRLRHYRLERTPGASGVPLDQHSLEVDLDLGVLDRQVRWKCVSEPTVEIGDIGNDVITTVLWGEAVIRQYGDCIVPR
jgi:hypothetical protein